MVYIGIELRSHNYNASVIPQDYNYNDSILDFNKKNPNVRAIFIKSA